MIKQHDGFHCLWFIIILLRQKKHFKTDTVTLFPNLFKKHFIKILFSLFWEPLTEFATFYQDKSPVGEGEHLPYVNK